MKEFLERISKLSPKRLALLAVELNSKLERLEQRAPEPIAVVGIGCRFPGGAEDPDSFWQLLLEGRDAITEVPRSRWDIDALYDPDPDVPGKMSTRWGGFLEGVEDFDPEFFGISPREATGMDPQQRILLEVVWEALEDAGLCPDRLAGSQTGVFLGLCNNDYFLLHFEGGRESADAYVATGNAHSVASGRISYLLGLQGPSISVDTGCSASLVAVHLACQSLRSGESRVALAGGVNLILMPDTTIVLSKAHMMSPDGRCKAFDASADGFVRSEGCGIIVLKRLSDARADGNRILAVIRGTASNQDGRSNGLTAPNGPSQVAVIREALANAGLRPSDVDYIEAHGTGTSLGDPIEARALADVFGADRASDQPLRIGSVKTNIGHAESAAGIAGLIKAILAIQHGRIPPSLHLEKLNPHIDWNGLAMGVPAVPAPWNRKRGLRIAGVSSFGFSGTNAHVIVSDPPDEQPVPDFAESVPQLENPPPLSLLPLSARKEAALAELAGNYHRLFDEKPDLKLGDICQTAATGRSHFEHRLAVVAADIEEAKERLAAFRQGKKDARVRCGRSTRSVQPGIVFLFTGQGSQYPGMGRQLFQHQPVFRRELERCAEIVNPLLEIPLLDLLFTDRSEPRDKTRTFQLLDQTQYTQPALFALEYALATMWRSWGLEPAAVLGHSVGEYVAACVAGVFSLEDGLRLITERGRLMASLPYGGAMAAVFADEFTVAKAIETECDRVAIACLNGPANVVVSGESVIVDALLSRLKESGVKSRSLQVSHAFHSPMMDPILAAFRDVAAKVQYSEPSIAIGSNVTGTIACPGLMTNPEYWRRHVRHSVRFADSVRALREKGFSVFLEIGPNPVLNQMARMTVPETDVVWADSLKREQGDWESLLQAVSTLYVHGVDFDWTSLQSSAWRKPVALPTYPFQRGKYWLERRNFGQARLQRGANRDNQRSHPLLGKRLDSPAIIGAVFESETGMERPGFLNDHRVFGRLIMPSPVFVEMALAGAAAVSSLPESEILPFEITDLMIREPLLLPEQGSRIVQLILDESSGQAAPFRICSRTDSGKPGNPWQTHATGHAHVGATRRKPETNRFEEIQARCCEEKDAGSFYESLLRLGLQFGERFRGVARIWRRDGEALGQIKLAESLVDETGLYRIHPALLDSCFHLFGAALPGGFDQNAYLLIGLERITLFGPAAEQLWNHTVLHPVSSSKPEALSGDMWLYDQKNRLIAEIIGLQLRRVTGDAMTAALGSQSESWFYDLKWREQAIIPANREKMNPALAVGLMPAPELLAESARSELRALAASEKLSIYEAFIPKLEALSTGFVNQAINRLGWSPQLGESFTTRELADRLAVVSTQRRLFDRLLGILAEDGTLESEGGRWRVLKPLQAQVPDLPQRAEALKQQFPACSAEVTLTARCGDRLSEALSGTCDPLQLLFPGGDFDLANALYRTAPFARALNGAVRHLIVRALQDLPKDRIANILEIGAGTGGTTSFLLPHLPAQRIRYAFTDVSPVFLTKARDEFRDYPFAGFELLDIEKSPGSQGFGERKFDVIIAANVFHATRDLAQTLRNAVGLLADGGLLILLEATARRRWVDLTFGLTEGWWRFEDSALRRDCALLPGAAWTTLFEETGLEAAELTAASSDGDDILGQAILIGRKRTGAGRPIREAGAPHGFWIVFSDTKGIAEQVTALISERGEECLSVSKAGAFEFTGTQHAALDPLWSEGFARLFSSALARRAGPLRGVLNLWPLDEDIADQTTSSEWEAAQARLGGAVLHTAQAFVGLQSENISPDARLWFATCGAQSVSVEGGSGMGYSQPLQAIVWGLARTISLEHPGRFGAVIDLDPKASPDESAAAIWHEIMQADGEDAVAYRDRTRLLPRIAPSKEPQRQELTLSGNSSYLITGGLGGLGLRIARWMAARGAGHVILLSRRNFPDRTCWPELTSESPHYEATQCILNAEKLGTKFTIAQGDVADEVAMRALLQQLSKGNAPLRGIVHAAVEMTSHSTINLDLPSFQEMCRAKALGAWVLHRITSDTELDFLVFFSSTTALWGVAGLAHYAAANQALDILAHWRREHGLPALSVNWGTWQEMRVANEADKKRFEQAGLLAMPDAQALSTLGDLLQTDRTAAVVASVNWEALRDVYEARRSRPIFSEMRSQPRAEIGTTASKKSEGAGSFLKNRLESTPVVNRRKIIREHLCSLAGEVLGFDLSKEIDLDQGLFDMGMDSLMAVELKGRLERSLGVPLPSTLTFNFPTINALTDYLLSAVFGSSSNPSQDQKTPPSPAGDILSAGAQIEDLSEDEISILLQKRLEQIS